MSRRPTRASSKKTPNPALEKLKRVRDGTVSHLDLLKDSTEDLYEEVDDREYLLRRQRENRFIEDDDGSGYIDEGQLEFNYESDQDQFKTGGKRKHKSSEPVEEVRTEGQIQKFFGKASKLSRKKESNLGNDEMLDELFKDYDAKILRLEAQNETKPKKKKVTPSVLPYKAPESSYSELGKIENLENSKASFASIEVDMPGNGADTLESPIEERMSEDESDKHIVPTEELISEDELDKHTVPIEAGWKNIQSNLLKQQDFKVEEENTVAYSATEGAIYMYWIDAYVQEATGQVFLIGKTYDEDQKKYVSCCVIVKSILRNVFLLPNPLIPPEEDSDAKMERIDQVINEIAPKWQKAYGNQEYNLSLVTRNYAFDLPTGIPRTTEYIKLTYPITGKECPFARNLRGKGFSHVFGANTSALELLLVKRKMRGPGWLRLDQALSSENKKSHCRREFEVSGPKNIHSLTDSEIESLKLKPPPLSVMSINIKTVLNPKTGANEVAIINMVLFPHVDLDDEILTENRRAVRINAVRELTGSFIPDEVLAQLRSQTGVEAEVNKTERALLSYFLSRIAFYDPDVLVGHNFLGFTLDVLLTRMDALQISNWGLLGRLRRAKIPKNSLGSNQNSSYLQRALINGRLICDTYLGAKDNVKSKNYSMGQLCSSQLNIEREDIPFDRFSAYFEDPKLLLHLINHGSFDAYLTASLMFKLQLLPLSKQLTILAGNLWNFTMTGGRANRNEFLLLHEFHQLKYLCPDKKSYSEISESAEETNTSSARRKAAYSGGLVLDPKRGLYDSLILLLDFNSLYPSIIQEFNICFTTVTRNPSDEFLPELPDSNVPSGLLPKLLRTLIERRSQVKSLLKDKSISASKANQLDIRQKALKLTANSMYGCLGFPQSRFYAKQLAMLITAKGRETLQKTVDLATNEGLEIVYGDTDSIMINTHTRDLSLAKQLANAFKKKVNQCYKKLEIDIDGIFKRLLLLQKKKYAALMITEAPSSNDYSTVVEAKGLDLVRREFCELSHSMSGVVLDYILSGEDKERVIENIHEYLVKIGEEIRMGKIPREKFVIYKSISKPLNRYSDAESQPHVQVAIRLEKARGAPITKGETIDYIICQAENEEQSRKSYALRAHSHDEMLKETSLKVDYDWYLSRQLLPPITRLCECIEGTDAGRLASCLGLDPSKYTTQSQEPNMSSTLSHFMSGEDPFQNVEKLNVPCLKCNSTIALDKFVIISEDTPDKPTPRIAFECAQCSAPLTLQYLLNQIQNHIRSLIRRFQSSWVICDEPICSLRTRSIAITSSCGRSCLRSGCEGIMNSEFTTAQLYNQLRYLSHIFDVKSITKELIKNNVPQGVAQTFINENQNIRQPIAELIEKYSMLSARRFVNLRQIFNPYLGTVQP